MLRIQILIISFFVYICLGYISSIAYAEGAIVVVCEKSRTINNITINELKEIYLRKTNLDSNGMRWVPVNLPSSHELRQAFSMILFKKKPEELEEYWNEQYIQGITPPTVLASEEAVLRFVSITPGAIGYVHSQNVDDRVKLLLNLSNSE